MKDIVDCMNADPAVKGLMQAREQRLKKEAEGKHEQPTAKAMVMSDEDSRVLLLTKIKQHIKMRKEQNQ
ncbi:hypothetical protein [Pseudomonas putida]|uniref:hypothetical protein n=1 Tax=Pseudomonas putida TaxID=303 RepID=UPI0018D7521C|nr:hypothetical protein [Pseudomonas putida]MBH3346982.1 hypothetical protein [Pseudomonas putida]